MPRRRLPGRLIGSRRVGRGAAWPAAEPRRRGGRRHHASRRPRALSPRPGDGPGARRRRDGEPRGARMSILEDLRAADLARRRAAIETLGLTYAASAAHLEALADCLADARKAVQRPAAEAFAALHRHGIDVRGVLATALASADGRRRWGAAY